VGPAEQLRADHPEEEERCFRGCALLPGLINVHTHLEYSAMEGLALDCEFGEWMLRLLLARRKLSPDDYAVSALWAAHECVRSGVTSIADTSFEGWTVARAAREAGLRARVYLEVFGLDDDELPATIARLRTRLDSLRREPIAGVEWGISPHAPYSVSARLYREVARLAGRERLPLATHLAESPAEVELLSQGGGPISQAYKAAQLWKGYRWQPAGLSPVGYVAKTGALGPDTLAIHAVRASCGDIKLLAGSGAAVAHCPRSNRSLLCGRARVAEMIEAGIRVGLGTDSLASNESLDMFAEMRAAIATACAGVAAGAAQETRAASPELRPLAAEDALRMATIGAARALGWDSLIGSLQAGKRADVIAVKLPEPSGGSSHGGENGVGDPISRLVTGAVATDVVMTMRDGAVLFEGQDMPVAITRRFDLAKAKLR
jgi:aminodeoxyfutalosine deaminase